MRAFLCWKKTTSLALVLALLCLSLPTSPAVAGWVSTRPTVEDPKTRLVTFLEREDISRGLQEMGIDSREATRRVAGLTDAEARMAADRLEGMPAGGNALVSVIGFAVVIFLVLLITDILGYTDVFPFVKKTVK